MLLPARPVPVPARRGSRSGRRTRRPRDRLPAPLLARSDAAAPRARSSARPSGRPSLRCGASVRSPGCRFARFSPACKVARKLAPLCARPPPPLLAGSRTVKPRAGAGPVASRACFRADPSPWPLSPSPTGGAPSGGSRSVVLTVIRTPGMPPCGRLWRISGEVRRAWAMDAGWPPPDVAAAELPPKTVGDGCGVVVATAEARSLAARLSAVEAVLGIRGAHPRLGAHMEPSLAERAAVVPPPSEALGGPRVPVGGGATGRSGEAACEFPGGAGAAGASGVAAHAASGRGAACAGEPPIAAAARPLLVPCVRGGKRERPPEWEGDVQESSSELQGQQRGGGAVLEPESGASRPASRLGPEDPCARVSPEERDATQHMLQGHMRRALRPVAPALLSARQAAGSAVTGRVWGEAVRRCPLLLPPPGWPPPPPPPAIRGVRGRGAAGPPGARRVRGGARLRHVL